MRPLTEISNLLDTLCARHSYEANPRIRKNELHLEVKSKHEEWVVNLRSKKTGNVGGIMFTTRELMGVGWRWEELLINRFHSAMAKIDPPRDNPALAEAMAYFVMRSNAMTMKEREAYLYGSWEAEKPLPQVSAKDLEKTLVAKGRPRRSDPNY